MLNVPILTLRACF